ncbi:hypothetical protein EGC79_12300 [Shewanella vesiculosa]|nr:hypothetical protein EGC79_12300 [Shewanella vesiculosa]
MLNTTEIFSIHQLIRTQLNRLGTLTSFCPEMSLGGGLFMSDRRHLLPSAALLRTQRATFTALGSSLHKGIV